MRRAIVGYHLDAAGDWVAELSSGQRAHARDRPFEPGGWVLDDPRP